MQQALPTDEHRNRVIEQLSYGFANERFEVEELERRLALAEAAETPAALDALIADLALVPTSTALVPAKKMRAIFGSIEKVGAWTVPQHIRARVVFGSVELDLREAQLSPITTIDLSVTFGSVEVIVPPGVAVEIDAQPTLGSVEDETNPVAPTKLVRITGNVRLGSVEVETLQPGETRGDARRRRRWERRHARREHRRHHHMMRRELGRFFND
ncbi:MAG TPA: LiaF domain-containing protein [Kofleriaceae bacterium]